MVTKIDFSGNYCLYLKYLNLGMFHTIFYSTFLVCFMSSQNYGKVYFKTVAIYPRYFTQIA